MDGIASTSWSLYYPWSSCWLRVSKACPCFDPSVYFASSNWPNLGSLSMTSWQSWPTRWAPCPTWPSSFALSSSSLLWWACNSLAKTTPTKCVKSGIANCPDGTSRTSCTVSWLCSESSVGSGSNPCGTVCMWLGPPVYPIFWLPSS